MAIIKFTKAHTDITTQGMLPDQFVSEKEKQSPDHMKRVMDYFATVANAQVSRNVKTFVKNYNKVKGIITKEDFYMKDNPNIGSFVDALTRDIELPDHVVNYTILNPPLNTLLGELVKRPDFSRVKAYDEDSKNEELQAKTDLLQQFILQGARERIIMKAAQQGQEIEEEELQQLTIEEVEEYMTSYTSMAERWANHILTLCKIEFNMKELSEDCFRDLLIVGREFFHIYEDNSKTGFGVESLNTKNVWFQISPDKKYTSDPKGQAAYAAGIVRIMELGEIIQRYSLPKEEIDHLRKFSKEFPILNARESNFNTMKTGDESIIYDTYSPLIAQERMMAESELRGNIQGLNNFLGEHPSVTSYDNKFVVVEAYWESKVKFGLVHYTDEQGEIQSDYVDENYEPIPTQIGEVQWSYRTQWYKGLKIGHEIYHVEPYMLLDYCPIIGVVHEIKNTDNAKSLVDLLMPYQVLYNVCMNQLFKLLEKEVGNVYLTSIRHIPVPKDGDAQDALEIWEQEARAKGIVFVDDSPENMKGPSAFNNFKNIDLTRTTEIKSRYELAMALKREAWELVGISQARQGSIAATQTATGTQTELTQSYAQTEPYFVQHEYVLNQVYQALLDAAQRIETQKPFSTVAYVNSEGEQAFIKVNADELRMRDLKVFVTSRAEDQRIFEEMRQLSQAMLQNGATPYDIAVLYTTNSVRQMRDIFKSLKEKQEQMFASQQQMEQQKIEGQQQAVQMQLAAQAEESEKDRINENYNKELDRISKEKIAIISATGFGQVPAEDTDADAIPDVLEMSRLAQEHSNLQQQNQMKITELQQKERELATKRELELEKIKVTRENMANDKEIAKIQAAAAKAKANKPKPKSKK